MSYEGILRIEEIRVSEGDNPAVNAVNVNLGNGWQLLDVHQRGEQHGDEGYFESVYILGNTNADAEVVTRETLVEELRKNPPKVAIEYVDYRDAVRDHLADADPESGT